MNFRTNTFAALLCLCLVALAGCAKKTSTGTPPVPQTTVQRIQVASSEIAKANNAFEQEIENLQAAGTLSVSQARPVIKLSSDVATTNLSVRKITTTNGNLDAIAAEVTALLTKFGAEPLAKQGISNQQLLALFQALRQSIQGLLDIIRSPSASAPYVLAYVPTFAPVIRRSY